MTFSVDVDFWPFQAGPPQDATARQSAGEGRGKAFAGSLFGVSAETSPSADLILDETGGITYASLSLLQPALPPAAALPAQGILTPQTAAGEIPLPEIAAEMQTDRGDAAIETALPAAAPNTETAPELLGVPVEQTADIASPDVRLETPPASDAKTGEEIPAGTKLETAAPIITSAAPGSTAPPLAPAASTSPVLPAVAAAMAGTQPVSKPALAEQVQPATSLRRNAETPSGAPPPVDTLAGMLDAENIAEAPMPGDELGLDLISGVEKRVEQPALPNAPLSYTAGGISLSASPGQTAAPMATQQTAPALAMITTAPAQLPEIVARATSQGQEDSILVQLDPPELGRVSIDFKFDAQGLQHVVITADSPEAMRQLRQMHFELVQALERNGLSGQSMSFQHQNPQQQEGWGQPAKPASANFDSPALTGSGLILTADTPSHRQAALNGRLDIRL